MPFDAQQLSLPPVDEQKATLQGPLKQDQPNFGPGSEMGATAMDMPAKSAAASAQQPSVTVEDIQPASDGAEQSVAQILSGGLADPGELPKDEKALLDRYGAKSKELVDILQNKYGPEASEAIKRLQAKIEEGGPKPPKYEEVQKFEPYKPSGKTWTAFAAALFGMMAVFGAKGGARGALAAGTGVMNGFREGNMQKAEEERKNFNQHLNEVNQRNDSIQREYQSALAKHKDDLNGLQVELSSIATKYQIPILAKQTEMGATMDALKILDGHWRASEALKMKQQQINNSFEMLQLKKSVGGLSTAQIKSNMEIVTARDQFAAMTPEEKAKVLADGRSPVILNSLSAKIYRNMTKSLYGGDPSYASINSYAAQAKADQIGQFPWSPQNSQEIRGLLQNPSKAATQTQTPPTQGQQGGVQEGQTATGPNGQKLMFKGGRWLPVPQGGPTMMNLQSIPAAG